MRKILTSGRNWTAKAEFEKQDLLYIELHFILVKGNPKPDLFKHLKLDRNILQPTSNEACCRVIEF